jgi:hypothetical protein
MLISFLYAVDIKSILEFIFGKYNPVVGITELSRPGFSIKT